MNASEYLSSEQVSLIWTTYSASTIRELAQQGKLPVARWEPVFRRDAETIRAILNLVHRGGRANG